MYFTFQESKIWESGDPVDPNGDRKKIRAKSEMKARKKLPETSSIGRVWVLVGND